MHGRNAFAVLMGAAQRPDTAPWAEPRPKAAPKSAGIRAKCSLGTQLHLDLGQRDFAVATCTVCGMLYGKGLPEEERLHDRFHNAHAVAFDFPGWVLERVILRDGARGRLLCVLPDDPRPQQRKVAAVCGQLERVLGLPPGYLLASHLSYKVFLWVSAGAAGGGGCGGRGRVTGVLVAQLQQRARWSPLELARPAPSTQRDRRNVQRPTAAAAAAAAAAAQAAEPARATAAVNPNFAPISGPVAAAVEVEVDTDGGSASSGDGDGGSMSGRPVLWRLDGRPPSSGLHTAAAVVAGYAPRWHTTASDRFEGDGEAEEAEGQAQAMKRRCVEQGPTRGPSGSAGYRGGTGSVSLAAAEVPATPSSSSPAAAAAAAAAAAGGSSASAAASTAAAAAESSTTAAAAATAGPRTPGLARRSRGSPDGDGDGGGGRDGEGGGRGGAAAVVLGVRALWVEFGWRRRGLARRLMDAARCCMVPGVAADRSGVAFSACAAAAASGGDDGGAAFAAFVSYYLHGGTTGNDRGTATVLLYDDDH